MQHYTTARLKVWLFLWLYLLPIIDYSLYILVSFIKYKIKAGIRQSRYQPASATLKFLTKIS
jgi:hypothetical protein